MAKMNPKEIKAKMQALEALLSEADGMHGDDLENDFKGLKKVTVASDSKHGLEEGLEKASEMMDSESEDESELKDKIDEDMMKMDSSENELSLPEMKHKMEDGSEMSDKDMPKDEENYMKKKPKSKSKSPKLNFFE
jgi:hypothetical protein